MIYFSIFRNKCTRGIKTADNKKGNREIKRIASGTKTRKEEKEKGNWRIENLKKEWAREKRLPWPYFHVTYSIK